MKNFNTFSMLFIASLALLVFRTHGAPIPLELVNNDIQFHAWPLTPSNSSNSLQQRLVASCRSISMYRLVTRNDSDFTFVVRVIRGCSDSEWEQEFAKYWNGHEGVQRNVTTTPIPVTYIQHYQNHERNNAAYLSANSTAWIGVFILMVLLCMTIICTIHLLIKKKHLTARANMIRVFKSSIAPKAKANDYI